MDLPKRNPPYILAELFKVEKERLTQRRYDKTGRDLRAAKELLEATDMQDLMETMSERIRLYLADDFWRPMKHPAYGLFNNWSRYEPVPEPRQAQAVMIECSACGRVHAANAKCLVEINGSQGQG